LGSRNQNGYVRFLPPILPHRSNFTTLKVALILIPSSDENTLYVSPKFRKLQQKFLSSNRQSKEPTMAEIKESDMIRMNASITTFLNWLPRFLISMSQVGPNQLYDEANDALEQIEIGQEFIKKVSLH
jgi:hypothetical protein